MSKIDDSYNKLTPIEKLQGLLWVAGLLVLGALQSFTDWLEKKLLGGL